MDYQYIYTVVKGSYVVLPSFRKVPSDIEAELARYAGNFVGQSAGIDEDFCYFSLKRAKGLPVLGFGKSQRKLNCASVAKMTQCAAWDWDETLLRDRFDEVLRFAFYSEAQVDACAEDESSVPAFGKGDAPVARDFYDVPLTREAIRAILYGIFSRWLLGKAPVRIAVPARETARYGQYVLSAVRKIYSYFPVVLRGEAGFVSRLQPGMEKNLPRISLIFVPEAMADAKTLFLDGSKPAAFASIPNTTNRRNIDRFIEHLSSLDDPEERKSFLNAVFYDLERKPDMLDTAAGDARQYGNYGEVLLLLDNKGSTEQKIEAWLRFCENAESYPAGAVDQIRTLIDAELSPEALVDYARSKFPGMDKPADCVSGVTGLLPLCWGNTERSTALVAYLAASAAEQQSSEKNFRALDAEKARWKESASAEAYDRLLTEQGRTAALKIYHAAEASIEQTRFDNLEQFRIATDRILSDTKERIKGMLPPEKVKSAEDHLIVKRNTAANRRMRFEASSLR